MNTDSNRDRQHLTTQWMNVLGGLLFFAAGLAYVLHGEYQDVTHQERERLSSQAAIIEKNLVPQLLTARQALENIRDELPDWATQPDKLALAQSRMKLSLHTLASLRNLGVVDGHGTVIATSLDLLMGKNLSHQEWFKVVAQSHNPNLLYLVKPFKTAEGPYTVGLARAVVGADGRFAGAVFTSFSPNFAKILLDSVLYTADASSAMVHGDGWLIAVQPEMPQVINTNLISPNSLLSRHLTGGQTESYFWDTSDATGDMRMQVLRSIQPAPLQLDKPLIVMVSRDPDAVLAPWNLQVRRFAGLYAMLALGSILGMYLYQRRQRIFEHTQALQAQTLIASEARLQAIFDASPDALLICNAQGYISMVNKHVKEMLGYAVDELIGRNIDVLLPMDVGCLGQTMEVSARRKSGASLRVEVRMSQLDTAEGVFFARVLRDVTVQNAAQEQIHLLAFYDPLTHLPNRSLLVNQLKQAVSDSERTGQWGALLFIDLDNFKAINETLGHDTGDLLLKQVGVRIRHNVRDHDLVGRLGGDEFVVVLRDLGTYSELASQQAREITTIVLNALGRVYALGLTNHHSTASIGVTMFKGSATSVDVMMKRCDLTMYKAKAMGRNTSCFFDPAMEEIVRLRAAMELDMRDALNQRQFLLHYQAQVQDTGEVTGAEVLLRWQHPTNGLVSPANFIPLAEETGLIVPIGRWVLHTACTQLCAWAKRPDMAHLTLAVNVSPRQFGQADFVREVAQVLADTEANPRLLKLELTEGMLAFNLTDIVEKMSQLKTMGVCFSLDDFGTGYSSLAYLKRLPLDQLKIDQSFVRDVLVDDNDAAIAKTIVALGHSLGMNVIAEGVETREQRDFLANHGCHAYQGYFFSRPLALAQFENYLAQHAS